MAKTKEKAVHDPFIRLAKRNGINTFGKLLIRTFAMALGFLFILIVTSLLVKDDFANILDQFNAHTFANDYEKHDMYKNIMYLTCISLALIPAFKLKFWNIGAQGQVIMGALFASIVVRFFGPTHSNDLTLIFACLMGLLGGAIWAVIPALFKITLNTNETLFTLMMNYIAIKVTGSVVEKWKDVDNSKFLQAFKFGHIEPMFGQEYGFMYLTVLAIMVIMFLYMKFTKHGYEISVVGESKNTAKYAGINVKKVTLRTILLSGIICGFVGFLYIGIGHTLKPSLGGSYGFTAIIVAWAGQLNPFAMLLIAFLTIYLENGAMGVVDNYNKIISSDLSYIYVALFFFFIIAFEFFINYKLVLNDKTKKKVAKFKLWIATHIPFAYKAYRAVKNGITVAIYAINRFFGKIFAKISRFVLLVKIKIKNFIKKILAKIKKMFKKKSQTKQVNVNEEENNER